MLKLPKTAAVMGVVTSLSMAVLFAFFAICSSSNYSSNSSGNSSSWQKSDHKHLPNDSFDLVVAKSMDDYLGATVTPHFETVTSNTKPPLPPSDAPLPNPKTIAQCNKQWSDYFSQKKATELEIACCIQRKTCECIDVLCKTDPSIKEECKDTYHPESCTKDCDKGDWSTEDCMALRDQARSFVSSLNWLWVLVIIAALMIILVCVTICCVFRKKFTGRESKEDKEHGKISFGPMNVKSKVKWHGKGGGGSSKSKSKSRRKSSKKSSKKSTSKKGGAAGGKSGSKKSKKTVSGKDGLQKVGVIGGHAGKQTSTMRKRTTMSDNKLLAAMKH